MMRAKFIYEKFTEDSDPIQDLGIGLVDKKFDFKIKSQFYNYILLIIPHILSTSEISKDILCKGGYINRGYFSLISDYLDKYDIAFNGLITMNSDCKVYYWPEQLRKILLKKGFKSDHKEPGD